MTKELSKQIGSSRVCFATGEDRERRQLLGVQPGSASVLGLLNDTEHRVTLVLDRAVAESRWFGCHPCRNTSSLRLRTEDVLEKFLPLHRPCAAGGGALIMKLCAGEGRYILSGADFFPQAVNFPVDIMQ